MIRSPQGASLPLADVRRGDWFRFGCGGARGGIDQSMGIAVVFDRCTQQQNGYDGPDQRNFMQRHFHADTT